MSGEIKRNPAQISERAGKTQLMAAFYPDDAKPLGADASLPCVHCSQHLVNLDLVNDVEYHMVFAKKRVISKTAVPTIFLSKLSDSQCSVDGLGGNGAAAAMPKAVRNINK